MRKTFFTIILLSILLSFLFLEISFIDNVMKTIYVTNIVYDATLEEGIDFSKEGIPSFLVEIKGLSVVEEWGRWSDANLSKNVEFIFAKPLPREFILHLEANFASQHEVIINIGSQKIILSPPFQAEYHINIASDGKTKKIQFTPTKVVVPHITDKKNAETRKLAIGFKKLWITPLGSIHEK